MLEIEFTAAEPHYIDLPHPQPAKKFVPSWYKKMSRYMGDHPNRKTDVISVNGELTKSLTIKACVPVLDYQTSGYILPLWQDILVENMPNGGTFFHWANNSFTLLGDHPVGQVKGSPLENETNGGTIYKFFNPWRIKTPPGYSCFFFSPFYHRGDIEILPAIVDTDGMKEVNFPFLFKGRERQTLIEQGTPIVQILPFKREEWTHIVREPRNHETAKERMHFWSRFSRQYRKSYHHKKTFT